MAQITLKGNAINTLKDLPKVGEQAPDFKLIKTDLGVASLADYKGKKVVLNIFPSLDTPTCAMSVRKFNAELSKLENTIVLCISKDLPFAHGRFCSTEGLEDVISLSEFQDFNFSETYGVKIIDGPLAGLMSRAVVILDEDGKILYTEQVSEIVEEPNYEKAIEAIK